MATYLPLEPGIVLPDAGGERLQCHLEVHTTALGAGKAVQAATVHTGGGAFPVGISPAAALAAPPFFPVPLRPAKPTSQS